MLNNELMTLLGISAVIGVLMQAIKVVLSVKINHPVYTRLQPLVAMALGTAGGYFILVGYDVGIRIMWGAIAGGFSSGGYSVINGVVEAWKDQVAKRPPKLPVESEDQDA